MKTPATPDPASTPVVPAPGDATLCDKLILAIVRGHAPERMARAMGIPEGEIESAVAEARRRLTLAADFKRDEQFATAVRRLNDCYAKSIDGSEPDLKTAMAAQKELNRLMDLYRPTVRHVDADGRASAELAAVRAHLPLKLGGDPTESLSTEEMTRLAVTTIMDSSNAR